MTMAADSEKIDLIIQYALLVAGNEDDLFSRQLGPIHLIKYVYLADLFYARKNKGRIYTGVDWIFYHFGPWSQTVYSRIEPALAMLSAHKQVFESNYGKDDWCRWDLTDTNLQIDKEKQLPREITMWLRADIHKYLQNTPSLLDYVYKTAPMIHAAPNESLDFSLVYEEQEDVSEGIELQTQTLSIKKQKNFQKKMVELRQEFQKKKSKKPQLVSPIGSPRYDEVFIEGLKWLDSLGGDALSNKKLVAKFSPEVWKSSARKGKDVP